MQASVINDQNIMQVIETAIANYAARHPRPVTVNQKQAAHMLGISEATMSAWVKSGRVRLNKAGQVSITEIDRLLECV